MTLTEFLDERGEDGKKLRLKHKFAIEIGVAPSTLTSYIDGRCWPSKDVWVRIIAASGGKVTPNDSLQAAE